MAAEIVPPDAASRAGHRGTAAPMAKAVIAEAVVGALLFFIAGTVDWPGAWAFLIISTVASLAYTAGLLHTNPALLDKRQKYAAAGTPMSDKILGMLGAGLLPFASWMVSALDRRLTWAPQAPDALQVLGGAGLVLGWGVFLWAILSNRFFASTVFLQPGHTAETGGPYSLLRHPGYLGLIIYQPAAPLLMGSWWGLAVAVLTVPILVLRTALEDRWLQAQVPGYRAYAARVRYRLLPGMW